MDLSIRNTYSVLFPKGALARFRQSGTKPRASLRLLSASAGVSIRFRKKNEIVFSGSIEKSILLKDKLLNKERK